MCVCVCMCACVCVHVCVYMSFITQMYDKYLNVVDLMSTDTLRGVVFDLYVL
jgi:hypothetical protein